MYEDGHVYVWGQKACCALTDISFIFPRTEDVLERCLGSLMTSVVSSTTSRRSSRTIDADIQKCDESFHELGTK